MTNPPEGGKKKGEGTMKRRIWTLLFAFALALSLTACGGDGAKDSEGADSPKAGSEAPPESAPEPLNLEGEWKQTNSNSDDTYQGIYIAGDTIEIYWVMEGDDMTALYWAGSFEAPSDASEPYEWDSQNDTDRTASALMASSDESKTFTYKNGKITYTASALGETVTVEAEQSDWGYAEKAGEGSSSNEAMSGSGTLGDFDVAIKGASLTQDYDGNPAIVITYSWTNNSEETTSAMAAMMEKAFQDGVQLETAMILDSGVYDSSAGMKDVRPGTTIDIQCAYVMTSETSIVEFELTEFFAFTNDMVTMDFDPAAL